MNCEVETSLTFPRIEKKYICVNLMQSGKLEAFRNIVRGTVSSELAEPCYSSFLDLLSVVL